MLQKIPFIEVEKPQNKGSGGGGGNQKKIKRHSYEPQEMLAREVVNLFKYGPKPSLTVDGIILNENKEILLIKRKNPPFQGMYALPGGFVNYNESVEDAVLREVKEETNLKCKIKGLVGVYSKPGRDPRGHVVSVVFYLKRLAGEVKSGDDAADFKWFSLKKKMPELAFDHKEIIEDFKKRFFKASSQEARA